MVERFRQRQDANELTQSQAGGISSLRRARGVPNQNKSNPGVSGRPLGPPRRQPAPPPGAAAQAGTIARAIPAPPRGTGGPSSELPINTRARVQGQIAEVRPDKLGTSREENVDGVPGRTKSDDVRPGTALGAARPKPPPPAAGKGAGASKGAGAAPPSPAEKELAAREESALKTGAPIDPATGQPQAPDFDGAFTNEQGHALNPDGTAVLDAQTGAPLTPEKALAQDIQAERGDTSQFMAERDARAQKEKLRRQAPSEIEGINTGHFEDIVREDRFKKLTSPRGTPISEMKQREIQENVRQQLREFGSFPGQDDPDAPAPPIREMGRSFNPFTGKFTGETAPNAFKMMGFDFEASKREFFKRGGRV